MNFEPQLRPATLIKRYKRFLADVELEDGTTTTIHVANTGAMTGCWSEGDTIWYSTSNNPKRKLPLSWELTKRDGEFICVNTIRANQIVEEALSNHLITELAGHTHLQREVKYGNENSKIDFLLTYEQQPETYIEVKSCTLLENKQGYFPDVVTTRGQKHLRELTELAKEGKRAILLFCILHTGINSVKPAKHIDPKYAELFEKAQQAGVEVITYKPKLNDKGILI